MTNDDRTEFKDEVEVVARRIAEAIHGEHPAVVGMALTLVAGKTAMKMKDPTAYAERVASGVKNGVEINLAVRDGRLVKPPDAIHFDFDVRVQ